MKLMWMQANLGRITLKRYGLTPADFEAMAVAQNFACAICLRRKSGSYRSDRLAVDHCHETGRVRGLLCADCNNGLGKFCDDPIVMQSAIDYLRRYEAGEDLRATLSSDELCAPDTFFPRMTQRERNRAVTLKEHGLSMRGFSTLCKRQEDQCAICVAQPRKLSVDHDHASGAIRGLLCAGCNFALGAFFDSIATIQAAIDYLSGFEAIKPAR